MGAVPRAKSRATDQLRLGFINQRRLRVRQNERDTRIDDCIPNLNDFAMQPRLGIAVRKAGTAHLAQPGTNHTGPLPDGRHPCNQVASPIGARPGANSAHGWLPSEASAQEHEGRKEEQPVTSPRPSISPRSPTKCAMSITIMTRAGTLGGDGGI